MKTVGQLKIRVIVTTMASVLQTTFAERTTAETSGQMLQILLQIAVYQV